MNNLPKEIRDLMFCDQIKIMNQRHLLELVSLNKTSINYNNF